MEGILEMTMYKKLLESLAVDPFRKCEAQVIEGVNIWWIMVLEQENVFASKYIIRKYNKYKEGSWLKTISIHL